MKQKRFKMKTFILLIIILFTTINLYSGEFGLERGFSKSVHYEDYEVVNNERVPVKRVIFADGPFNDAFGRLRVSEPVTIFDAKQLYDGNLVWTHSTLGSGSYVWVTNASKTTLSVTSSIGDKAIKQTKQHFNYQPAKSQLCFVTFNMKGGYAGVSKTVGMFDSEDGLGFRMSGTTPQFFIRSFVSGTATETTIDQTSWNINKLDGTSSTGETIDFSKAQIFISDYEWLGVGRIRFGFVLSGKIVYCHEVTNLNSLDNVYLSKPVLPIRYEIANFAGTTATTMDAICSSLISEGGFDPRGRNFAACRGVTGITCSTANYLPLISIRLKSGYKNVQIELLRAIIFSSGNVQANWRMILNPTITGGTAASWVSANENSAIEYDISQTGTVSGGTVIHADYVSTRADSVLPVSNSYGMGKDINGTSDIIVIAFRALSGSDSFYGSIEWKEMY